MSMSDPPAAPPIAVRNALVDAIGRRRRRTRSRLAVAGGVCVAVAVAVLAGGVFTGGGPEPVLAIDEGSEWVTVRLLDGEAGAAEMTQELQDAGIDGEGQLVPSLPPFVGHGRGVAQVPKPQEGDVAPTNETPRLTCTNPPLLSGGNAEFHGDVFQIRREAISKLAEAHTIFYVGREPEPGETALEFPPDEPHTSSVPLGR